MTESTTKKRFANQYAIATFVIGVLIIATFVAIYLITSKARNAAKTAQTGRVVAEKQAGALVESGKDAVNTVANRIVIETRTNTITKENTREIESLNTQSPTFDDDLQRAGINGLCRYDVYSTDPRCMQ